MSSFPGRAFQRQPLRPVSAYSGRKEFIEFDETCISLRRTQSFPRTRWRPERRHQRSRRDAGVQVSALASGSRVEMRSRQSSGCVASLRKEHLVRVRDRDLPAGDFHDGLLRFRHGRFISRPKDSCRRVGNDGRKDASCTSTTGMIQRRTCSLRMHTARPLPAATSRARWFARIFSSSAIA